MVGPSAPNGFAVICNEADLVEQVLQNDFRFQQPMAAGHLITRIFDEENVDKVLRFLQEARNSGTAFDWELVVVLENSSLTLHCAAARLDGQLLVIGATSRDSALQVIEEMLKINNDQTNSIRLLVKELQQSSSMLVDRDNATYEELTRLNNEMAAMQRELMKKNHELAQLNQQKNYFLGMASHDLRTPLSTIVSFSEYLCDQKKELFSEDDLEMLSTIRRSSDFMLALIDDLLDISKIESGNLHLNLEHTDLKRLVAANVDMHRYLAEKKRLRILFTVAEPFPEQVVCDSRRIEQVLNNLLSNAIKFSYPDSVVEVSLFALTGNIHIVVDDSGSGMTPTALEQIFTPFTFASKAGTFGEKGTGLGLAIARRIIEGHGGTIRAENREEGGTRLTVILPVGDIP